MFLFVFICLFVHLSVCLSVCLLASFSKTRAWIWMKCCVLTDVGASTNWLTFEPDPDYSPDAGTGLLSPISHKRCYAENLRRENPIGGPPLQRGVVLKWFNRLRRRNTFVGGTCALPSILLVVQSVKLPSSANNVRYSRHLNSPWWPRHQITSLSV